MVGMLMIDIFVGMLIAFGGVSGFLFLLGQFIQYKRCNGCRYDGDVTYMHRDEEGHYWHISCVPTEKKSLQH